MIELYKLQKTLSPEEQYYLKGREQVHYLPTEIVIDKPQIVTPQISRSYELDLWLVGDKIVDYNTLRETKEWEEKPGTYHQNPIILFEYFTNCGDDGHVDYKFYGWIYVDKLHFEKMKQEEIAKANKYGYPHLKYTVQSRNRMLLV